MSGDTARAVRRGGIILMEILGVDTGTSLVPEPYPRPE
jgi:hypothetical protein